MTETYTFNSLRRNGERQCYSYDSDTGDVTNHNNGKVVNIGKGIDFLAWLTKIGAYNIKQGR